MHQENHPEFPAAAAAAAAATSQRQPQKNMDISNILRARGRKRRLVINIIDWVDPDGHYGWTMLLRYCE
jgi:hypothetical protein